MTDNRTTDLLPCPFCGGEATVERIGKSGYYYVACNTAYCCDFGKFDTESEAIAAWNTRASDRHSYELRITGDGSNWSEIMRDAYDGLIASASESCTPDEIADLEAHIAAELGGGECEMYRDEYGVWHCSSCEKGADKTTGSDGALDSWNDSWPPNFCPYCGAKVVSA